jgi:hypothetical protein
VPTRKLTSGAYPTWQETSIGSIDGRTDGRDFMRDAKMQLYILNGAKLPD